MKKPTFLHPGMVLLFPGNPKFNFLPGGKQEQHINESSTLHSYDQREQPDILLITWGHLPVLFVCFKCSRKAALSTAPEVTGSKGERTGRWKELITVAWKGDFSEAKGSLAS